MVRRCPWLELAGECSSAYGESAAPLSISSRQLSCCGTKTTRLKRGSLRRTPGSWCRKSKQRDPRVCKDPLEKGIVHPAHPSRCPWTTRRAGKHAIRPQNRPLATPAAAVSTRELRARESCRPKAGTKKGARKPQFQGFPVPPKRGSRGRQALGTRFLARTARSASARRGSPSPPQTCASECFGTMYIG